MIQSLAKILREYGPFPGVGQVHGVTFDGQNVWFASGDRLNAVDPASGKIVRSIDVEAHAGTAFDGQHLFQLAGSDIQKIDPKTGQVVARIPAPAGAGLALLPVYATLEFGPGWFDRPLLVGPFMAVIALLMVSTVPTFSCQRRRYSMFSFLTKDTTRTLFSELRSNSPNRGWSISSSAASTGCWPTG